MRLPADVYVLAVQPHPAWPSYADPGYEPSSGELPSVELDLAEAIAGRFSFLADIGFVVAPPDRWERSSIQIVPFVRDDAIVLVVASDRSLFVAVSTSPAAGASAMELLASLVGSDANFATYGSFPIVVSSKEAADRLIARHAETFRAAAAVHLAGHPIDYDELVASLDEALERTTLVVHAGHYRQRADAAWSEERFESALELYGRLGAIDALTDEELARLERSRLSVRSKPPLLERGDEDDKEWILRRAALVRQLHQRLEEAFERRDEGPARVAAWEDAARAYREAIELMYPEEFWRQVDSLRQHEGTAVDPALTFLEADPWCFRSGYAKETILRLLPRHSLSNDQVARVERVLLHGVDVGDRREFRFHCRLARHVATPEFRRALFERLHGTDVGVARRALWMLTTIRRPRFAAVDITRAQELVLAATRGSEDENWTSSDWTGDLASRFWSPEWESELLGFALADGERRDQALRLLARVRRTRFSDEQRDGLGGLLLDVVDNGGDESWFEYLAPRVDTASLRSELERRLEHEDGEIRRRARWAHNSIRRALERQGERAPDADLRDAVTGPVADIDSTAPPDGA